jgi:hypothetical protein
VGGCCVHVFLNWNFLMNGGTVGSTWTGDGGGCEGLTIYLLSKPQPTFLKNCNVLVVNCSIDL